MPVVTDVGQWRKSSRSSATRDCVEVALGQDVVVARDSKDPGGPVLRFKADGWREFIQLVRAGAFDSAKAG